MFKTEDKINLSLFLISLGLVAIVIKIAYSLKTRMKEMKKKYTISMSTFSSL